MAEGFGQMVRGTEQFRTQADEYRELDDERVLVFHHVGGRGKTSGLELGQIATKGATLFHLGCGKVTKLVIYFYRERALADLDLPSEADSPRTSSAVAPREGQ